MREIILNVFDPREYGSHATRKNVAITAYERDEAGTDTSVYKTVYLNYEELPYGSWRIDDDWYGENSKEFLPLLSLFTAKLLDMKRDKVRRTFFGLSTALLCPVNRLPQSVK